MENKNPFKLIGLPAQEAPKELKQKIMNDANTVKFLIDMASLFTSNYTTALQSLFKTKNQPKTN